MYVSLQIAAALAVLSEPFLPFTSNKLSEMLDLAPLDLSWKNVSEKEALLPSGHVIKEAQLLFRRIEDSEIDAQVQKLHQTKIDNAVMEATVVPQKDTSSFEDFSKLDLRTGTILSAEKMPKAKKLLVLQVQTGLDTRTIVSGIAEHFSPEEVVGKKVTVLVNLAPRTLRGVESEGMILMTEHKSGKLVFVNPDEDGVADGTVIS
jgi:methionyl-tRNA synthetase